MEQSSISEMPLTQDELTQDERLMAAMAHISMLVPMVGVIVPIVIWVTQKDKSRYIAFQALQGLALQLAQILTWFLGMACYMLSFFTIFLGAISLTNNSNPSPVFFSLFFFPFVVMGLMLLLMGFYIVYGIVAAVQCLRGKPFRYVVIGRQVERFMAQSKPAATAVEDLPPSV